MDASDIRLLFDWIQANPIRAIEFSISVFGFVALWIQITRTRKVATAAKEVFVAQMGIVYSVGEADNRSESLRRRLREAYSPLVAYCIMLFCLISTPCVATLAATWQESGSWKFPALQLGALTALAYVITVIVYQVGSLWT